MNLQQDAKEPYDACPYCLTEIIQEEEPTAVCDEIETFEQEEIKEPEETEAEAEVEETAHLEEPVEAPSAEVPSECPHHLGYLSEKSSKEKIPDECIMCKDIVTCMLKKMKE